MTYIILAGIPYFVIIGYVNGIIYRKFINQPNSAFAKIIVLIPVTAILAGGVAFAIFTKSLIGDTEVTYLGLISFIGTVLSGVIFRQFKAR